MVKVKCFYAKEKVTRCPVCGKMMDVYRVPSSAKFSRFVNICKCNSRKEIHL